jgi:UTP--glucose-1-phosphate uridylyltransferase
MEKIDPFIKKMRRESLPEAAIDAFAALFRQFSSSTAPTINESELCPLKREEFRNSAQFGRYETKGNELLPKTAAIKLNGGLGTTMDMHGPKSLITVKNGLTFLDITLRQIMYLNKHRGTALPLVLMNSFFTDTATNKALAEARGPGPCLPRNFPRCFIQHKFPKILESTLEPISCPSEPAREWHPAGHGDLLLSLHTSGLLERLISEGCQYLFVSNIDNLGAEIDPRILGYFATEGLDFLMEVTERTKNDCKGGLLTRLKNGRFVLRETAQCGPASTDSGSFQDFTRHQLFNTNNLWITCEAAQRFVRQRKFRDLPVIINRKRLSPQDPVSPPVCQLESALGSAISLFEKSAAVIVPRSRFAPVKNCDELLLAWSDFYVLGPDYRLCVNPARTATSLTLKLDPEYYSTLDRLQSRFPHGAPSFVNGEEFTVSGDVKFGVNTAVRGSVSLINKTSAQVQIKDNAVLTGCLTFPLR